MNDAFVYIDVATTASSDTPTTTDAAVSAEDALNSHQKKMQLRSEVFNKARAAHMKEFQARFTKEQQVQYSYYLLQYTVLNTFCIYD